MSQLIFNLDDQILIMIITVCLVHVVYLRQQALKQAYHLPLIVFLMAVALGSLDTMFTWSSGVKQVLEPVAPVHYFALKWAWFVQGPLLYLFAKSVVFVDFRLSRADWPHAVPIVLSTFWLPLIFLTTDHEMVEVALTDFGRVYGNPFFKSYEFASKFALVGYGMAAYHLLRVHAERVATFSSNPDGIDGAWLKVLLGGFTGLWAMGLTSESLHHFGYLLNYADAIGMLENALEFTLINTLVFMSLSRAAKVLPQIQVDNSEDAKSEEAAPAYTPEQIERLQSTMQERKLYLEPDLSLEQLSDASSLPQRLLSHMINRHFEKNFFEFVNHYRVEHAKRLLVDPHKKWTMLEIMAESGFNSKSAYNRVFRNMTGLTPSQYRDQKATKA